MYSKFSQAARDDHDKYGLQNAIETGLALNNLAYPVMSQNGVAGSTGATTNTIAFIMPTKGTIEAARFVISVVQTGTGNLPVVNLYNLTQSEIVAAGTAIQLAGAVGDVSQLALTTANAEIAENDVLALQIVNPAGTITIALEGQLEFDWHSTI